MPFNLFRKDPKAHPVVMIITGSCCIPGFATFDEQARQAVAQAIAETGAAAQVKEISASSAMYGAVPRSLIAQWFQSANSGQMPLPAVLVNGNIASTGIPVNNEAIKSAMLPNVEAQTIKEKKENE